MFIIFLFAGYFSQCCDAIQKGNCNCRSDFHLSCNFQVKISVKVLQTVHCVFVMFMSGFLTDPELGVIPQSESWAEMVGRKRSAKELRALWRKAIMEQILLIRMERENNSLQGSIVIFVLFALVYIQGSRGLFLKVPITFRAILFI